MNKKIVIFRAGIEMNVNAKQPFWPCLRREKLDYLVTTGIIEVKRNRRKQHEKMMDGLTKWLQVGQGTEPLKATRDRDAWKVMIAYAKEHRT